jgi:hypothetical protein
LVVRQRLPIRMELPSTGLRSPFSRKDFHRLADADFVYKSSSKIFVQHARDERLVGYPFLFRSVPQALQILVTDTNVDVLRLPRCFKYGLDLSPFRSRNGNIRMQRRLNLLLETIQSDLSLHGDLQTWHSSFGWDRLSSKRLSRPSPARRGQPKCSLGIESRTPPARRETGFRSYR